jgi:hypothetical protein
MANNRMHFVCNVCLPKGYEYDYGKWLKVSFHVAKWYPGEVGEWYTAGRPEYSLELNKFFEAHAHSDKYPGGVENPVRLEYEWMGTPAQSENKKEQ